MAKYEQYDTVLLKDGQTAAIVEVLASGAYIADIGHSPSEWNMIDITDADILRKATPEDIRREFVERLKSGKWNHPHDYLGDYLGKDVEIIDDVGKRWTGHVALYEPAIDRDEDEPQEDGIAIRPKPEDRYLVDFNMSEILWIRVVN